MGLEMLLRSGAGWSLTSYLIHTMDNVFLFLIFTLGNLEGGW